MVPNLGNKTSSTQNIPTWNSGEKGSPRKRHLSSKIPLKALSLIFTSLCIGFVVGNRQKVVQRANTGGTRASGQRSVEEAGGGPHGSDGFADIVPVNDTLSTVLIDKGSEHRFVRDCSGLRSFSFVDRVRGTNVTDLVSILTSMEENRKPIATRVQVSGVPCAGEDVCCVRRFWFRFGSTDVEVFRQVLQDHYLKILYPFSSSEYARGGITNILDAGANAGFSTYMLRMLFPDATIVSVEPDPANFKILERNTKELGNVHLVHGGLWNESGNIKLVGDHGDWGRVFQKVEEGGSRAFSVADLQEMHGIDSFDLVKLDIEGAESIIFGPEADTSWLNRTKLCIIEVHDFFGGYFGVSEHGETSRRVDSALMGTPSDMVKLSDNEHKIYLTQSLLDLVLHE
mmetsp:Transcript_7862/g.15814  ORF Transcript_7862/g.15814 Transcript_7862/m.15814 type:complete len:399 (-) Transcript_7862:52-1248(-)